MRPKNVILLEIMIIVTNFNDADLFYYLLLTLLPNSAGYRALWRPWNGASRRHFAYSSIVWKFFPQSVCVFVGCAFHVYQKGFKAIFGTGRQHHATNET